MLSLVLSNINGRRGFSVITTVIVALGVTTFLVLLGLIDGTFNEIASRMENTNAELMVHKYGWTPGIGAGFPLHKQYGELIAGVPGVSTVVPIRVERIQQFGPGKRTSRPNSVYGIEPEDFNLICPGDRIVAGRGLRDRFDMVIDEVLALDQSLTVGDTVRWLGGREFTIVGIAKKGVPVRVFVHTDTVAEFDDTAIDRVTFFFVKVRRGVEPEDVEQRIEQLTVGDSDRTNLAALPLSRYMDVLRRQLSLADKVIYGVMVISLITSSMIIFLTMYQAVKERTRDVGILKSLGAGKGWIASMVILESLVLCLCGVALGVGISFALKFTIQHADPTLVVGITPAMLGKAALCGILGGTLGALYPGYLAARSDPVVALSYE